MFSIFLKTFFNMLYNMFLQRQKKIILLKFLITLLVVLVYGVVFFFQWQQFQHYSASDLYSSWNTWNPSHHCPLLFVCSVFSVSLSKGTKHFSQTLISLSSQPLLIKIWTFISCRIHGLTYHNYAKPGSKNTKVRKLKYVKKGQYEFISSIKLILKI